MKRGKKKKDQFKIQNLSVKFHIWNFCICSGWHGGTAWVCSACHQSFTGLVQGKINRPLMKLLNHKPVRPADQRLRGSQAWLEAYWNQPREALEPSHLRLTIYCTVDLGLTTFLSLNRPLTCACSGQHCYCVGEFFKRQFNPAFCLTPLDLKDVCVCVLCVCVSPGC